MRYTWSTGEDLDNFSEDYDTIEDCIKEAKDVGCKAGSVIYIGMTTEPNIRGVELSDILEKVHDNICDDMGEVAEEWYIEDEHIADPKIYQKYEDDINDLIIKYIEEIGMRPDFKEIVDIKPFVIKDVG